MIDIPPTSSVDCSDCGGRDRGILVRYSVGIGTHLFVRKRAKSDMPPPGAVLSPKIHLRWINGGHVAILKAALDLDRSILVPLFACDFPDIP